jgi:microfibrillar-associated protein 1
MASGGDPFSILNRDPERGVWKKPEPKAKVARYIAGKKPRGEGSASGSESEGSNIFSEEDTKTQLSKFSLGAKRSVATQDREAMRSQVIKQSLPENLNKALLESIRSSMVPGKTQVQQVEKAVEKVIGAGLVEVVERRRRAPAASQIDEGVVVKADEQGQTALGKRVVEEPQTAPQAPVLNESEGDDEDEDEDKDEENEPMYTNKIHRPVFVQTDYRENIDLTTAETQARRANEEKFKESMKNRNKQIVIEAKKERNDADEDNLSASDMDLPNDSSEDEDLAYEKWRVRELMRLKRDQEERDRAFREKEAVERRRQLTDEERAKEDKRIGKYKEEQKSAYKFMQKFYSKGIFGDQDDPIFKRDYNIAVGEDLFDKSVLPSIKHVRRGQEHKKGKSKYTHLVAEDTTNFDPEWLPHEDITNKQKNMLAGYKNANQFERPTRKGQG